MNYKAELDFLMNMLQKMHIQAVVLSAEQPPEQMLDFGLRKFLGREAEYEQAFQRGSAWGKDNTIYKLVDAFCCSYTYFFLPGGKDRKVLLVGPYVTMHLSRQQIMEMAEKMGVPADQLRQMESYYENIPVVEDTTVLFIMLTTFAEQIWGQGNAYEIVDVDRDSGAVISPRPGRAEEENILLQMQIMETRYAYENELMDMVSKGLVHRAEMMFSHNLEIRFEQRMADPLRNLKNYCIICNTLLRKAAERGGVHPVYLDGTSSAFAREIESATNLDAGTAILKKMVSTYSRLVRKHTSRHYSPPVQKAVTCIESDLSGELGLKELARLQGISPSYLSTLFKKETGQTLTDYVQQRRVGYARQLLASTKLQVQTIAQYCGIPDVNYFSKTFKKYAGMTPMEYRAQEQGRTP